MRFCDGFQDSTVKNKSLIQQPADQIFSMLTVLREYALERLKALGEAEAIRQKHALYYCQWLEEAQPHLNGRDQIEWFGRMKVELYNLQAALEWFLQQQAVEDAVRKAGYSAPPAPGRRSCPAPSRR